MIGLFLLMVGAPLLLGVLVVSAHIKRLDWRVVAGAVCLLVIAFVIEFGPAAYQIIAHADDDNPYRH